MVEKKLFKTKLCVLYRRGRCGRRTCSFAHGDAELRRYSGSFNGRRDKRVSDLRDRLGSRHSPRRRFAPKRDARAGQASHGHGLPRSVERRKYMERQYLDGMDGFPEPLRFANGTDDLQKEGNILSSGSIDVIEEQLRQVKSDLNLLIDRKVDLEAELEERAQEADSLTSRIGDLESQLSEERENCKRITSEIKKFIRAHNKCNRLQGELKKSQSRLNKLVEDLRLDSAQFGGNEEDSSINIVSDGETTINNVVNKVTEQEKTSASPVKKRLHINLDTMGRSKSAAPSVTPKYGPVAHSLLFVCTPLCEVKLGKRALVVAAEQTFLRDAETVHDDVERLQSQEGKFKRRKDVSRGAISSNKLKPPEANILVPPTSMAAHAVDELGDMTEAEERMETVETDSKLVENGAAFGREGLSLPLPPPPPPPPSKNYHAQFGDDDEEVDVDGREEEVVVADIV